MTKLVNGTCNLKLIIAPPPSRHFCLPTVLALISLFHLLDQYRSIDECGRQCLLAVGGVKDLSDVTEQVRRGTGICKQPLPFISICLVQPFHVLCHDRQLQSFPLCVMQHQIQNTRRSASELHLSQRDDSLMPVGMRKWYRIFPLNRRCAAVVLHQHFTRVFYVLSFGMNYGKFYGYKLHNKFWTLAWSNLGL